MWNFLIITLKNIFSLNEKSREIEELKKEVQGLKIKQASFETFQRIFENSLNNSKDKK